MERIRYLAGGLLILTGVVHVLQLLAQPFGVNGVIMVIFGVLYLLIGVFLFRRAHRNWYMAGTVLPMLGILLTVLGMLMAQAYNLLQIFFVVIDVIVAVCCIYLVTGKK